MKDEMLQPQGGLRPRLVPEAFVRAEIASFPLVHVSAFKSAVIALNPEVADDDDSSTKQIWSTCESEMSRHGWSLDRLIAIRDFFWFCAQIKGARKEQPVPLHRYLRHLAKVHLTRDYWRSQIVRGEEANEFDAITHYRWLAFSLPEDLLLAAIKLDIPPAKVDLEPPLIVRRLLDEGVAEIHHHIAAGMDFPLLWASILTILTSSSLEREGILEGPDLPFENNILTVRWLLAGAISRALLAEFLIRSGSDLRAHFLDFLDEIGRLGKGPATYGWRTQLRRTLENTIWALGTAGNEERLPEIERRLPEIEELRDLYSCIHPGARELLKKPPVSIDEVWRLSDPIAVRLGLSRPNAGERWLMLHALERLESQESAKIELDEPFARLFWQVIRLRCLVYRCVVQRPMTPGLLWFVRYANRLGLLRKALEKTRVEVSYRVALNRQSFAALEVRTSPRASPFDLAEELSLLLASWRKVLSQKSSASRGQDLEFGVLLHYLKQRDPEKLWEKGSPPAHGQRMHSAPTYRDATQPGGRFANFFSEQSHMARATVKLIQTVPIVLWLVRGIDVAADELAVPTWVLVPLYNYVRQWSCRALLMCPENETPPPLRFTAHVGEDFRHLMEGLRHIFECVRYLLPRAGSRLGHGTALGYDPRLWAELVGSVMMPQEERLWDLVFEWRLYSEYRVPAEFRAPAPPGRAESVENQIRELSEHIFGSPCEPHVVAEAHHVLHMLWCEPISQQGDEVEVGLDSFKHALDRLDWTEVRCQRHVKKILRMYREDETVYRLGRELVDVALDEAEVAALFSIQNTLRRCVGARGIVVEVNPSSNLLIGNMLDLRNHPILRLYPPQLEANSPPPIHIALGSDDPLTFSTCLVREYSLLYEAALSAGYSERVVYDWLAAIRQTSMDARFTVPWMPSAKKMSSKIMRALNDYLLRPRCCVHRSPRARS